MEDVEGGKDVRMKRKRGKKCKSGWSGGFELLKPVVKRFW